MHYIFIQLWLQIEEKKYENQNFRSSKIGSESILVHFYPIPSLLCSLRFSSIFSLFFNLSRSFCQASFPTVEGSKPIFPIFRRSAQFFPFLLLRALLREIILTKIRKRMKSSEDERKIRKKTGESGWNLVCGWVRKVFAGFSRFFRLFFFSGKKVSWMNFPVEVVKQFSF